GGFDDTTGRRGFLLDNGGSFTPIDVPGSSFTQPESINDAGQIVGSFVNSTGTHGFLDARGSVTPIDVPGASFTEAHDINNAGQIVAVFFAGTGRHGFLATPTAEPVPEPSTLTLLSVGIGLTVLCVMRHRVIPSKPL